MATARAVERDDRPLYGQMPELRSWAAVHTEFCRARSRRHSWDDPDLAAMQGVEIAQDTVLVERDGAYSLMYDRDAGLWWTLVTWQPDGEVRVTLPSGVTGWVASRVALCLPDGYRLSGEGDLSGSRWHVFDEDGQDVLVRPGLAMLSGPKEDANDDA